MNIEYGTQPVRFCLIVVNISNAISKLGFTNFKWKYISDMLFGH